MQSNADKNLSPLVTVYIPTYNRYDLLRRAVDSVLQQSHQNFELIIVDDCSTDNTIEYLQKLSEQDPRVRFFTKESNSGACTSRNIAIKHAAGEFITGLDDDDYFLPNRIEVFVKQAHLLDDFSFIYSNNYLKHGDLLTLPRSRFLRPKIVSANDLLHANLVGNQCFIRTEKMQAIGLFSEKLKAWQDMDTWYRLLSNDYHHRAKQIEEVTYVQDVTHEYSRISTNNRLKKIMKVYHTFCSQNKLSKKQRQILAGHLAFYGIRVPNKVFLYRILCSFNLYFLSINLRWLFKNHRNTETYK
ncbi:glycosyltransferase [Acinetobacter sp. YH12052]|uniref:glycosyltransferase n=1 Tax=Acinetobacter sp. YH12052 TaxID=2601055 RepID=UPI0015D1EC78|nr:glycosyltransferase [Acinetobacter sp. YH12052]